jgi:hypothetical protein
MELDGKEVRKPLLPLIKQFWKVIPDSKWATLERSCRDLVHGLYIKIAAEFKNSICQRSTQFV